MMLGIVATMVHAGVTPNNALRFAAFQTIESTLGREAIESLGLPASTARRWRIEMRKILADVDADALPDEMPQELLDLLTTNLAPRSASDGE
jgi:hypothetical protein